MNAVEIPHVVTTESSWSWSVNGVEHVLHFAAHTTHSLHWIHAVLHNSPSDTFPTNQGLYGWVSIFNGSHIQTAINKHDKMQIFGWI